MIKIKPIDFISVLKKSDVYIEQIYLNGGCYQFYKILRTMFPSAKPYINANKNHVVTMIDGYFYDITGKVFGNYLPLTKDDEKMCKKWSFSKNYWLYKECPNCEEPISS
ncbi:hypothetical protein [Terrihalobacillus insolitus]|uniref:hypothetical protein n=1 Tax=Terrihalobacillus insolitus TaxID=2950438 RepID=UPI00233FA14A|nr:hypothetical protein [Terrihalobacillus insolitus]MDC3414288.1 hypothetical protein [Terrihalobacillus insolitus]